MIHLCDEMSNAGSGIGDSLSVIQVNLSRLVRSDPHFHANTTWLFCGCSLPRLISQRAAQGAQYVPQRPESLYHQIQRGSLHFQGTAASTLRPNLR